MVHIFHLLQTGMVFGNVNPFSWIFKAISSEKKLPDFEAFPDLFTWRQDTRLFPACWILIGQFKFPARQPYARLQLFKTFISTNISEVNLDINIKLALEMKL